MFACEHEGIEPDLICMRQGHRDGLPLSPSRSRRDHGTPRIPAASAAPSAVTRWLVRRRWPPLPPSMLTGSSIGRQIERLMKGPVLALQAADDRIGDVRAAAR